MEHTPDASLLAEVFPGGVPTSFRAFKGKGCSRCGGTGSTLVAPSEIWMPVPAKATCIMCLAKSQAGWSMAW